VELFADLSVQSGYEAYDRLSPSFRAYLETLSAVHNADRFKEIAAQRGTPLRLNRGAPENDDTSLTTVHPVIRTNPVTGWKSIIPFVPLFQRIRTNEGHRRLC
jgi:alpha-ketoglutarate-dependent taurine dioxygenase